jgi:hypothetical protein
MIKPQNSHCISISFPLQPNPSTPISHTHNNFLHNMITTFYKTILLPSKHLPPPLGKNHPHPLNSPDPITLSLTYPKKIFLNSRASKPYSLQICFLFHNCNLLPSLRTSKNFVLFFPHTPPQSPLSVFLSQYIYISLLHSLRLFHQQEEKKKQQKV